MMLSSRAPESTIDPGRRTRPAPVAALRSVGARWGRVPVGYRIAVVVYVILRVGVMLTVHNAFVLYDSQEYRSGLNTPAYPFVSLLGHAMRPWPVPLFYALVPNDTLRMVAQVTLSIVAWLVLATTAGALMRNRWLRAVTFGSVLGFGSSVYVLNWDFEILAESLTISFAALTLAAWLRFTRRPSGANSTAAVTSLTVLMFLRPQLLPLVAFIAIVVLVSAFRSTAGSSAKIIVATALSLVVLWGFVVVRNVEETSQHRPEMVGVFTQNFVFVLQNRIQPDPETYKWFRDNGMPEPHIEKVTGPDDGGIQAVMRRYSADRELIDWIVRDGQTAMLKFSVVHPDKFPARFVSDMASILVPNRGLLVYGNVPSLVPAPIEGLIAPTTPEPAPPTNPPAPPPAGPPPPPILPPQIVFVMLFAVVAILPRRRPVDRVMLTTILTAFAVSLAGFYLGWVTSDMEPVRHAIPFTLLLPLCLTLATLALLDAVVGPAETSVDRGDAGGDPKDQAGPDVQLVTAVTDPG